MPTRRPERLAAQIAREASEIVRFTLADPQIQPASVNRAQMSPDLRRATIFVSVLGDAEQCEESLAALERATGVVRRELSARLRLRFTPAISFPTRPSDGDGRAHATAAGRARRRLESWRGPPRPIGLSERRTPTRGSSTGIGSCVLDIGRPERLHRVGQAGRRTVNGHGECRAPRPGAATRGPLRHARPAGGGRAAAGDRTRHAGSASTCCARRRPTSRRCSLVCKPRPTIWRARSSTSRNRHRTRRTYGDFCRGSLACCDSARRQLRPCELADGARTRAYARARISFSPSGRSWCMRSRRWPRPRSQ